MLNTISQGSNKFVNPEIRPNSFYQEILPHGNAVRVALEFPAKDLLAKDFIISQNGVTKPAVSASIFLRADFLPGTRWDIKLGDDWLIAGQAVFVQYIGNAKIVNFTNSNVPNNSLVRQQGINCFNRKRSFCMHFNMATYTVLTSGQQADPTVNVSAFDPTGLTSPAALDNWIAAAQAYGAETIMFTPQHSDGFMLWDSSYLPSHSIRAATTWWARNGFDIAREFCNKIRASGLKVGIYGSAWSSRWELQNAAFRLKPLRTIAGENMWNSEGRAAYTAHKAAIITEIMTTFGVIDEIIIDGWAAINSYPSYQDVDKTTILNIIKTAQPNCVILLNDYSRQLTDCDLNVYEVGVGAELNDGTTEEAIPNLVGGGPDFPRKDNQYPSRLWITPTLTGDSWFNNVEVQTYKSSSFIRALESEANLRKCHMMFNLSPDTTGLISTAKIAYLSSLNPAND